MYICANITNVFIHILCHTTWHINMETSYTVNTYNGYTRTTVTAYADKLYTVPSNSYLYFLYKYNNQSKDFFICKRVGNISY